MRAISYMLQGLAFLFLVATLALAIFAVIDGRFAFVIMNAVVAGVNFYLYCILGEMRRKTQQSR